ncbi:MAG TPA: sugar ABC transporter substrate-binding protein, partial [Kamptonema sp.]|nr:sugar ABC transporter substrate-binding protein [Kamptonema sp.]
AANVLPSTIAALQDGYFQSVAADAKSADLARAVSAGQMKDAEILIPAMQDIKKLQKAIYDNLQAAMLDQKSVDAAVTDAANAWNQR